MSGVWLVLSLNNDDPSDFPAEGPNRGQAAGKSGQHTVSPASTAAGSRQRLDRPATPARNKAAELVVDEFVSVCAPRTPQARSGGRERHASNPDRLVAPVATPLSSPGSGIPRDPAPASPRT